MTDPTVILLSDIRQAALLAGYTGMWLAVPEPEPPARHRRGPNRRRRSQDRRWWKPGRPTEETA